MMTGEWIRKYTTAVSKSTVQMTIQYYRTFWINRVFYSTCETASHCCDIILYCVEL